MRGATIAVARTASLDETSPEAADNGGVDVELLHYNAHGCVIFDGGSYSAGPENLMAPETGIEMPEAAVSPEGAVAAAAAETAGLGDEDGDEEVEEGEEGALLAYYALVSSETSQTALYVLNVIAGHNGIATHAIGECC